MPHSAIDTNFYHPLPFYSQAVEGALKKGQLKRVTGSGMSGTFSLVDGAQKTGGKYEDAIEDAIIANNAPKDASVAKLRDYLGEYYKVWTCSSFVYILKARILKVRSNYRRSTRPT